MKYSASFRIYDNPDLAYDCFLPEKDAKKRFELDIIKKEDHVELRVNAADPVALKAITTSMVKLMEVYDKLNGDEL